MSEFLPGDVIRDTAGNEVVVYYGNGHSGYPKGPSQALRLVQGEISTEEYTSGLRSRVAMMQAYFNGNDLPEGAIVTNEPKRIEH